MGLSWKRYDSFLKRSANSTATSHDAETQIGTQPRLLAEGWPAIMHARRGQVTMTALVKGRMGQEQNSRSWITQQRHGPLVHQPMR